MPEEIVRVNEANQKSDRLEKQVATPADFTSPEVLYEDLIQEIRKYHPSSDLSDIERAYKIARDAHEGQKRKSGEPYIIHPLCVAIILAELELDKETIIAGLLHDVVEDTVMTSEDVTREFGAEVALLVDGVTKLTQLNYQHDKIEVQAENLRKMFLAMAKDIRVILIKLADRLHNMRTMQYQTPAKQIEKSRETMEIYAPIAHRLGISKIKVELDDLSMQYLMPDVYQDLVEKINLNKAGREAFIDSIIKEVGMHISNAGIEAEINGRVKHFFSIYRKMVNQNKTLDQIYDIFAVRIIVDTVKDCYAALGVIHEMYKPIPGRFKDYIAMPKPNMYQSLHTTLIASNGNGRRKCPITRNFYRLLKMTSICFRTVCTALHHPVMSKIFRQVPVRSILHTVSTVLSVIRWSVQESMESLSILIIRLRAVTGLRLLHHRIPKDRAVTG